MWDTTSLLSTLAIYYFIAFNSDYKTDFTHLQQLSPSQLLIILNIAEKECFYQTKRNARQVLYKKLELKISPYVPADIMFSSKIAIWQPEKVDKNLDILEKVPGSLIEKLNIDSNGNKIYDSEYGKRMLPALLAKEYNCSVCQYHTIWENYFLATATICQLYLLNDGDPNLLEARLIAAHKEWYKYQVARCKSVFTELHFMIFDPAFSTTYIFLDLNPYSLMPAYLLLLE
jgi:hypothetical protein